MALNQLVEPIFEETGYQRSSLKNILSKLPDAIRKALKKDGKVIIQGIGSFSIETRKARKGRNPKTGEVLEIPAKKYVKFKTHSSLKNAFRE